MAPRNSTGGPKQPPQHKFDPANHHRSEIEARTAAGETCEQIASALRAQGVDITNKTISRRRVEWGLRKRPFSKLLGKKAKVARPKKASGTKTADTSARKAEIEARTARGESAEEIAAALEAGGVVLKKGASTILRLQTQWGLIEPDPDRARGRKRKPEVDADGNEVPKVRKKDLPRILREQEREANKVQQGQAGTLHYPSNCNFGPKKRGRGVGALGDGEGVNGVDEDGGVMLNDGGDDGFGGFENGNAQHQQPQQHPPLDPHLMNQLQPQHPYPIQTHNQTQQTVSVAAEIMSVEFLVDLATSTLGAANNLKDMLLAYQARTPVVGGTTGLPPSLEDLTTARRKVREAAAVMHDLAVEPGQQ